MLIIIQNIKKKNILHCCSLIPEAYHPEASKHLQNYARFFYPTNWANQNYGNVLSLTWNQCVWGILFIKLLETSKFYKHWNRVANWLTFSSNGKQSKWCCKSYENQWHSNLVGIEQKLRKTNLFHRISCSVNKFQQISIHRFKRKTTMCPEWSPVSHTLGKMLQVMHIQSTKGPTYNKESLDE